MTMTRIPGETPEQRTERFARARAVAAEMEAMMRALPVLAVPAREPASSWPRPADVPTPAQVLARARALLSPRAATGLDALPAGRRETVAHCLVAMHCAGLPLDTRHLERGQPWPDTIEGDAAP